MEVGGAAAAAYCLALLHGQFYSYNASEVFEFRSTDLCSCIWRLIQCDSTTFISWKCVRGAWPPPRQHHKEHNSALHPDQSGAGRSWCRVSESSNECSCTSYAFVPTLASHTPLFALKLIYLPLDSVRPAGDGPHRGQAWAAAAVGGRMHDSHRQKEPGVLPQQPHGAAVPRPRPEALHGEVLRVV